MSLPSDDPIEYWREKGGPRWVTAQEALDSQLAEFGDYVYDRADLGRSQRVLDIGCGTGASTLVLAKRLGKGAQAIGVDVSTVMLDRARERATQMGENRVAFLEADAQSHAFAPGEFEHMVSRFGVMFFRDPFPAFENLHRALKTGGSMTFVCWKSPDENPWISVPAQVAKEVIPDAFSKPSNAEYVPGPFSFQDRGFVEKILRQSRFSDFEIESKSTTCILGGSQTLDEAVAFSLEVGPAAAVLRDSDPRFIPPFKDALKKALDPFLTERGVEMKAAVWLVHAQK